MGLLLIMEDKKPVVAGGFNALNFEDFKRHAIIGMWIGHVSGEFDRHYGRRFDLGISMDFLSKVARCTDKYRVIQALETPEAMAYKLIGQNVPFDDSEYGKHTLILQTIAENGDKWAAFADYEVLESDEIANKIIKEMWNNLNK